VLSLLTEVTAPTFRVMQQKKTLKKCAIVNIFGSAAAYRIRSQY
jgi:hypothetical protein